MPACGRARCCGAGRCVQDYAVTQLAIDRRLTLIAWEAMHYWTAGGSFGGLGQHDHRAPRDELPPRTHAGHQRGEPRVSHAEPLAVPALEEDPRSQARLDPVQVPRMDRQPALALLAGGPAHAEA